MRILQYDKECEKTLQRVAELYEVDKEQLWELYLDIMRSNFLQDLHDIARENEDYFTRG